VTVNSADVLAGISRERTPEPATLKRPPDGRQPGPRARRSCPQGARSAGPVPQRSSLRCTMDGCDRTCPHGPPPEAAGEASPAMLAGFACSPGVAVRAAAGSLSTAREGGSTLGQQRSRVGGTSRSTTRPILQRGIFPRSPLSGLPCGRGRTRVMGLDPILVCAVHLLDLRSNGVE
jgi:hypothetical protein